MPALPPDKVAGHSPRAVDELRGLLYGVSAQRPSHSLFIGGEQLPLEARMGGLFLGFLGGAFLLAFLGRLRTRGLPARPLALACLGLVVLTGLDGLNAFFYDGGLPHLYAPNGVLRLLTGLGAGYGLALLALPVVAGTVWREATDQPAVLDWVEWGMGLAPLTLLAGLVLLDVPPLLWPVALLMLLGVLGAFGMANLYVLVLQTGRAGQAVAGRDLAGPLVAAVGLALIEVALLATVRHWLATQLGVTWGF